MRYKSRPIEVEAVQFDGDNWAEVIQFAGQAFRQDEEWDWYIVCEGVRTFVPKGHLIVKGNTQYGTPGEFYSVSPLQFAQGFEEVTN